MNSMTTQTERSRAKATRRASLLHAAAELFAHKGYRGASIEDLGAAAGVSGPAVYRHFSGKQAVLAALLLGVSEDLLSGGRAVVAAAPDPPTALDALIAFHVDFALTNPDVIRVQGADLDSLSEADSTAVRALQRRYVRAWVGVLALLRPDRPRAQHRLRAHAAFGLINSTPHTTHRSETGADLDELRDVLEQMARAALTC